MSTIGNKPEQKPRCGNPNWLKGPDGKGKSGNPNGRPRVVRQVVALAREHTEDAIETLVKIMMDDKAHTSARVRAAEILLDRGYGKAPQRIELNVQQWSDREVWDAAHAIMAKHNGEMPMLEAKEDETH
jgi:hypothetical protein